MEQRTCFLKHAEHGLVAGGESVCEVVHATPSVACGSAGWLARLAAHRSLYTETGAFRHRTQAGVC